LSLILLRSVSRRGSNQGSGRRSPFVCRRRRFILERYPPNYAREVVYLNRIGVLNAIERLSKLHDSNLDQGLG
jgi:hypothetical protein